MTADWILLAIVWAALDLGCLYFSFREWQRAKYRIDFQPKSPRIWLIALLLSLAVIATVIFASYLYYRSTHPLPTLPSA